MAIFITALFLVAMQSFFTHDASMDLIRLPFRRMRWPSSYLAMLGATMLVFLTNCQLRAPQTPPTRSEETFSYRKWENPQNQADLVIIGLHGFDGASADYKNLGSYLQKNCSRISLYAYEIRGQGNDPLQSRRGDIVKPQDWYRDLNAFTKLVRRQNPRAKIIWMGESMGALIAAHSYACYDKNHPPCQGLILSSPVVSLEPRIPAWLPPVFQVVAQTFPKARVPIDALANSQQVSMTETTKFDAQAKTNSYHVSSHTLRMLGTLSEKISAMPRIASQLHSPTLLLHGDRDWFTSTEQLENFAARLPKNQKSRVLSYPGAYHLLMYDKQNQQIFHDLQQWLETTYPAP